MSFLIIMHENIDSIEGCLSADREMCIWDGLCVHSRG